MIDCTNRVLLVTGASGGIGAATARTITSRAVTSSGLGEVAGPQDLANVIAFLASGLARHATGSTVDVDGASDVHCGGAYEQ